MFWYSETPDSPGVTKLTSPQSTDAAARQALEEQQHGDEFKPQSNPDIEAKVARLNELETEQTNLCLQLYGPTNHYVTSSTPYKGPPYLERLRVERQLRHVEDEICDIRRDLFQYVEAMGLNNESGSPFMGTAQRVVG